MTTTPGRPAIPEYGEYATLEQQAHARGMTADELRKQITPPRVPEFGVVGETREAEAVPALPVTEVVPAAAPAVVKAAAPVVAPPAASVAEPAATASPAASSPAVVAPVAAAPKGTRRADRPITLALLALGLFSLFVMAPGLLDLNSVLSQAFEQMGLAAFTEKGLAQTLGTVTVVAQIVIWGASAAASFLLMRRGRLSWWVPLVGAALSVLVFCIVVMVVISADPAFLAGVPTS